MFPTLESPASSASDLRASGNGLNTRSRERRNRRPSRKPVRECTAAESDNVARRQSHHLRRFTVQDAVEHTADDVFGPCKMMQAWADYLDELRAANDNFEGCGSAFLRMEGRA
jgi:hypothetical protein